MTEDSRSGFAWSCFIHVTAISLLAYSGGVSPSSGPKGLNKTPEASPTPQETKKVPQPGPTMLVEIVDPPSTRKSASAGEDGVGPKVPHGSDKCKEFYGGVGLTQSTLKSPSGEYKVYVIDVHPGYPAQAKGIREGDVLLNERSLRGPVGTKVTVRILRDGRPISYEVVRDKICTSKKEKP